MRHTNNKEKRYLWLFVTVNCFNDMVRKSTSTNEANHSKSSHNCNAFRDCKSHETSTDRAKQTMWEEAGEHA